MAAATADILTTIASAERDVVEQIKQLTRRKDELQVELGTVREALEALHTSKRQLQELRAEATGAAAGAEDAPADSQGATDGVADAAEAATGGGQAALEESAREGGPAQLANRVGDAAEPATTELQEAVLRRQVFVKGLPVGAVDERMVATAVDAAFAALPGFDAVCRQRARTRWRQLCGSRLFCRLMGTVAWAGVQPRAAVRRRELRLHDAAR